MKKLLFILFICFCFFKNLNAQEGFKFLNPNLKKQKVSFKLINNIIIIPLEINGKKLSFILDTGVNKTILFNLSKEDSLGLKNVKKVQLQGLGKGEPVDALLSNNNTFKVKKLQSNNETVYVILNDPFDLSSKMGTTIHGIIGYNLLKNVIVKINYNTKHIDFFNPKSFKYKKCKKCETLPLTFHKKKPYVDVKVQLDTIGKKITDVKMLIDSGGSDAIWLFENSKQDIKTPKKFFNDILGEGLSGPIYGNRSRIPKLKIGKFEIKSPTVSFLDSLSTKNARNYRTRNGSIGSNILKRFKVWIDYPNKKITLKKNGSFTSGFTYNMSGLDVVYDGKQLIKEELIINLKDQYNQNISQNNTVSSLTTYSYKFKPTFKVRDVVKNSPADLAGLKKGDLILKINYKDAHEFTLEDIVYKLQEKHNKKVKIYVERNGVRMKFEFRLKEKI